VGSSRKRDKGKLRQGESLPMSWEESLTAFRIQLSVTEVSLVELATRLPSRKGSCGHSPKVWKQGVQLRGEVYSSLKEAQNVMAIVGRAVPWVLRLKNREKARERLYMSVCAPLTVIGTSSGQLKLRVTRVKSEVCCSFYPLKTNRSRGWSFFLP